MRKSVIVISALISVILFSSTCIILLKNPVYFASIISVSSNDVFNKIPDKEMSVLFNGKRFCYKFPVLLKKDFEVELKKYIGHHPADLNKTLIVNLWVREKLKFGINKTHYLYWQPQKVLMDIKKDNLFLCDTYARLAAAAAQTIGITSRVLWLGGHVVPEFYIPEIKKWVMVDPTYGYYMEFENMPLSVTEIIACYRKGQYPRKIVFRDFKRVDMTVKRNIIQDTIADIYTNGFTIVFDGENTEKGIKYSVLSEKRIPLYMQYLEENSKNMALRRKIVWGLNLLGLAGLMLSALIFFKTKRKAQKIKLYSRGST
ncbi:MAG TPA: hypothetical protein PKN36_07900 [bacterium]|nr:hypothetical protein [bacterium]